MKGHEILAERRIYEADAAKATLAVSGECGAKEQQPAFAPEPTTPGLCTKEYLPVCGVELQNLQCIKAPCPIGVYKTYGNHCEADSDKSLFAANGECGAKENQQAWSEGLSRAPIICTTEYDPVCGVEQQQLQCVGIPCFVHVFKTFSNRCEASAAHSPSSTPGVCGKREGAPSF